VTGAGVGRKQCGAGASREGLRGWAGLKFASVVRQRTKIFNPRRTLNCHRFTHASFHTV